MITTGPHKGFPFGFCSTSEFFSLRGVFHTEVFPHMGFFHTGRLPAPAVSRASRSSSKQATKTQQTINKQAANTNRPATNKLFTWVVVSVCSCFFFVSLCLPPCFSIFVVFMHMYMYIWMRHEGGQTSNGPLAVTRTTKGHRVKLYGGNLN